MTIVFGKDRQMNKLDPILLGQIAVCCVKSTTSRSNSTTTVRAHRNSIVYGPCRILLTHCKLDRFPNDTTILHHTYK